MKRYREISMGGARNPGDGSTARRVCGGARRGPSQLPGGGIDIDYCAFPTCPGNPRGIVSAPALHFCTLLPPPPSPTLSASHRQRRASLLLSACLSRFLFLLSLSLSLSLPASTALAVPFSPFFFPRLPPRVREESATCLHGDHPLIDHRSVLRTIR